jgi:hypothetical protein
VPPSRPPKLAASSPLAPKTSSPRSTCARPLGSTKSAPTHRAQEVQLTLRTAVAQLRSQRASALPLLYPSGSASLSSAILPTGSDDLGSAALALERDTLRALLEALRDLSGGDDEGGGEVVVQ